MPNGAQIYALTLLAALSFTIPTQASFTVRGGGDAVMCRPAPNSPFKGFQSLDYLVTYDEAGTKLVPVQSMDHSFKRLVQVFKTKLPELAPAFESFAKNYLNRDPARTHLWEPATFGLKDLKDEELIALLPENCTEGGRKAKIVQAVVRQAPEVTGRPTTSPVYTYVPKVLDALNRTNPLQLSFLVLHEWLWDLSPNVEMNRRLNRYFHSENMERLPREEILKQLRGLGFVPVVGITDLLFEESCLPDPRGTDPIFTPQSGSPFRMIPSFKAVVREIYCIAARENSPETCTTTMSKPGDITDRILGRQRGFEAFPDGTLNVFSLIAYGAKPIHLRCKVDRRTGKIDCGAFTQAGGSSGLQLGGGEPVPAQPVFTGAMNRTCIRLTTSYSIHNSRAHTKRHFTYVFFRKFE